MPDARRPLERSLALDRRGCIFPRHEDHVYSRCEARRIRAAHMNPDSPLKLGNTLDFMRLLWGVAHGLQSRSKRMETDLGITGPQRLVIRILGQSPGTTAGAIAKAMCVHPSTLTGVLRRLESRGIVTRSRDEADGRRALLELTAEGKKINRKKSGTVESAVERALERASNAQLAATREVMGLIIDELERGDR